MLCQRHMTPPHCLSKVKTLNPKVLLAPPPPREGGFLSFWPCGHTFWACRATLALPSAILQFLAFWAFISVHFGLVGSFISLHFGLLGLHFLAFWPFWAFISFHFGLFGVSFWAPPTSCQKLPVCPTSLQWIYQRRDRLHFAVFSLLGLDFLAFWPCGPSFPCILALWAFISLHFGLLGLHFLSFWPFRGQLLGLPPHKLPKMARLPNVLTMDLSAP